MVEDFGLGSHDSPERNFIAPKVRNQHLDRTTRLQNPNPTNALCKDPGAAVRQLVAVDTGEDCMLQPHCMNTLADPSRFIRIQEWRSAGLDLAEAAAARTSIAHQQKGRGTTAPTLADVGAHCLFADCVQMFASKESS